jgi:hypothetical protein
MQKQTIIDNFLSPANFEIEVNGFLDKNLSDYLGGLTINHKTFKDQKKTSCLTGEILDQAALIGILNLLYDMRFPILRVELINKNNRPTGN